MNYACQWAVLADSLAKTPPRNPPIYRNVTQAMRNHCADIRSVRASQQRDALAAAILARLSPDTPVSSQSIADDLAKSLNPIKRRLAAMEADGRVIRNVGRNQYGLKVVTWQSI